MRLILRILINAVALWVAVLVVPSITYDGGVLGFLVLALIFGVVNAFIRPIVKILSCPLMIVTLGLFTLVINAGMLWLSSVLAQLVGIDFVVGGGGFLNTIWAAFLGGIIVSIVSIILSWFLPDNND